MLSQAKSQVIDLQITEKTSVSKPNVALVWGDYVWAPLKREDMKGGVRNEKEQNRKQNRKIKMLYTIQEVATQLSISKTGVYRLINSGQLKRVYIQGCARVDPRDLQALIERARQQVSS